jgi:hypothetical protein
MSNVVFLTLQCTLPTLQTFEVLDANTGAQIKELDFGAHFFGEVLHRSIVIFNNGPVESKFLLT